VFVASDSWYGNVSSMVMVMDVTAGGGTEAVTGIHGDDNSCCLSDEIILYLAKLGIKVLA